MKFYTILQTRINVVNKSTLKGHLQGYDIIVEVNDEDDPMHSLVNIDFIHCKK